MSPEWVELVKTEPASPGLLREELVMPVMLWMGWCEEERRVPDIEDSMVVCGGVCGRWGSGVVIKDGALGYRFPMS